MLNRFNNFCHPNNYIKLIVDCLKTILNVLKRNITGTNFHKKSKSIRIVKSIQYFLPSEKSIKLSKYWVTFFKSGAKTVIIGTKHHKKSENFVQLKDRHAYYYKKYLSLKNFFIRRNFHKFEKIPNKKNCQINFCEYRSFIFRKTPDFIVFVEILAYSMCNFCK